MRAMLLPEPQEWVQPSVPWPVLRYRLLTLQRPISGTLDGVAGRRPVQNWACFGVAGAREQLLDAAHDGLAAHAVQIAVVAVELGRAGDAQPVAQAREDELVFVVGQRDLVRHRLVLDRQRHRVALGRVDRQADAQRRDVDRAQAAHRQHVGVGAQALEAAFAVGGLDMVDRAAGGAQRGHGVAHQEVDAVAAAALHQTAGEGIGVARLVLGGVGGAGEQRPHVAQRRLDAPPPRRPRSRGGRSPARASARPALRRRRTPSGSCRSAGCPGCAGRSRCRCRAAAAAACRGCRCPGARSARCCGACAPACTRAGTAAPTATGAIGAQAEQQRRVFAGQPLQHLQRRAGVGPGFGMADRDLAAVGEAGFGGRAGLAVDDGDVVPLLAQVIGRGDAEQAGAEDDDFHEEAPGMANAHGDPWACRSPCPRYLRDSAASTGAALLLRCVTGVTTLQTA